MAAGTGGLTTTQLLIVGLGVAVVLYATAVLALVVAGRRSDARAPAGFIPDRPGRSSSCAA